VGAFKGIGNPRELLNDALGLGVLQAPNPFSSLEAPRRVATNAFHWAKCRRCRTPSDRVQLEVSSTYPEAGGPPGRGPLTLPPCALALFALRLVCVALIAERGAVRCGVVGAALADGDDVVGLGGSGSALAAVGF
jgi:hypothetical protein